MLKSINNIQNISSFDVKNQKLVYLDNQKLFERSIYVNGEKLLIEKLASFYLDENYIICSNWLPNVFLINNNEVILLLKNFSFSNVPIGENLFVVSEKVDENNYKNFIYDLNKGEIINELPIGIEGWELYFENFGITSINGILEGIDTNALKKIWSIDIEELGKYLNNWSEEVKGEVRKILGYFNKILWVSISNHTVLGVDPASGEIKYKIREILDFKSTWLPSAIPDSYGMHLDEKSGKIIGFRWEFYWEIECETGRVSLIDLTDSFQKAEIRSDVAEFAMDENYIYFLQHKPGKLGVFDREQKALVWQYNFNFENGRERFPLEVKVDSGRVYVKDSIGTLHIFEKEKD